MGVGNKRPERGWLDRNRTMTVRLTTAEEWPDHGLLPDLTGVRAQSFKHFRGAEISVYQKSMLPASTWKCGTRDVWMVTPASVEKIYPDMPADKLAKFFVCEHQIEFTNELED